MKAILFFTFFVSTGTLGQKTAESIAADAVMGKAYKTLAGLTSVEYDIDREIRYVGENYKARSGGTVYFDFSKKQDKDFFRFQFSDRNYFCVYNGKHFFQLDSSKKEIEIWTDKTEEQVSSSSALYNSLYTIKKVLPELIGNINCVKKTYDSSFNQKVYEVVRIELFNRYIGSTGKLENFTKEYIGDTVKPYLFIFDKKTHYPFKFITLFNDKDRQEDHITVSFRSIGVNVEMKKEDTWFYSTYLGKFNRKQKKQPLRLVGTKVFPGTMNLYHPTGVEKIEAIFSTGKPVLIEYWIKNCGYCMTAFPKMQALQGKYGTKIQIISINTEDERADIEFFFNKHRPTYKMFYNGQEYARKMQIESFPHIQIIDRFGIVTYSNGFDEIAVEKEINRLIQE